MCSSKVTLSQGNEMKNQRSIAFLGLLLLVGGGCTERSADVSASTSIIGGDVPPASFGESCLTTPIQWQWEPTGGDVDQFTSALNLSATATAIWEKAAEGRYILRIANSDALTRASHEVGLEFVAQPNGAASQACGPGTVTLQRMVLNGDVIQEAMMADALRQLVDPSKLGPPQISDGSQSAGPDVAVSGLATEQAAVRPSTLASSGDIVSGDCDIQLSGRQIMSGGCGGKADETTAFITADNSGCTVELTWTSTGARGKLFAYKNTCWIDEAASSQVEGDIDLGVFARVDGCWVGRDSKVCLYSGD